MSKQFFRFLIIGSFNTGVTYLLYLALLYLLPYSVAYTISYILGIIVAYILNSKIVFKSNISIKKIAIYPIVYIIQYLINIGGLFFLVDLLGVEQKIAPIIIIGVSIPITFILNKYILG